MINTSHHIITQYIHQPSYANIKGYRIKTCNTNLQRYFEFLYNPFHYFYKVRRAWYNMINKIDYFIQWYIFTPPANSPRQARLSSGRISLEYFYECQYRTSYQFYKVIHI